MAEEALILGVLLSLIYFELFKVAPPGIVAPVYCALILGDGNTVICLLAITGVTFALLMLLSRALFIFGRRVLILAIIIGFLLSWLVSAHAQRWDALLLISHLVPGEIAHECHHQGVVRTLCALLIVTAVVKVYLMLAWSVH